MGVLLTAPIRDLVPYEEPFAQNLEVDLGDIAQVEEHKEAINAAPLGDLVPNLDIFPHEEPFAQNLEADLRDFAQVKEHVEAITATPLGDFVPNLDLVPHKEPFAQNFDGDLGDIAGLDKVGDEEPYNKLVIDGMSTRDKAEVCSGCLEYTVKLNHGITQANIATLEAQNVILVYHLHTSN
ncbi:unnamed protein product [Arabis nemorensis]|uniref:Uncharacterized protein n=1 Tax=Arabis nemorensis TaxID=586526 RepID=A0A565C8D4_9BRAS|nr:unnamed protein product [Arabis nemorensis]